MSATPARTTDALVADHLLEIEELTVCYRDIEALRGISFQIRCGHAVALLGPNGAGKSTLLKALAGLVNLATGTIHFHGRPVRGATPDIAYLPQREHVDWDFPATVRGVVEMGRYMRLGLFRRFGWIDEEAVVDAIRIMDLERLQHRQISELSGGQQQRAFLARALAQGAHVLLLDEPFTGLDVPNQGKLRETLTQLARSGKLIICSHHDLQTVPALFDHVVLLNRALIAVGPLEAAFSEANVARAFQGGNGA
jgi:ABC-type Mn2+/Zn2+ transport system ATPase subunit